MYKIHTQTHTHTEHTNINIKEESQQERFPCNICNKSYLRKRHLQRHMRDECIGIPPRFHCEYCPSKFRRKYHLVRHLSSKHNIPKALNPLAISHPHLSSASPHNNTTQQQQQQQFQLNQPKIEQNASLTDTENENMKIPNANILLPAITMTALNNTSSNADRFSVDALMMKQEMPSDMTPLDFSHATTEENAFDPNKIPADLTLRTFQNLKYLFTNFAMNNVPNFTST